MVDTPTTRNRFRKQETGTNTNTWGTYLNQVLDCVDQVTDGYEAVAITGDYTLVTSNYTTTDEAKNRVINFTGALTAAASVTAPSVEHQYTVKNTTTGGYAVTFKTAAGAGIAVPASRQCDVYSDASDYYAGSANWISNYASHLVNDGDVIVKLTLEAAIAAASGLTAPFILVSASDTTPGYLAAKISGSGAVTISTLNGGADEDLQIAVGTLGLTAGAAQTAGFTAAVNTRYVVNIAAGGTVTLPAAASVGDVVVLALGGSVSYTLGANGLKINASTSDFPIDGNQTLVITYTGTTNGWV